VRQQTTVLHNDKTLVQSLTQIAEFFCPLGAFGNHNFSWLTVGFERRFPV